jgi:hypothetical protein
LVVVLLGVADDGSTGFENIMDHAHAAREEMVTAGAITSEERSRMVLGAYPRRSRDLLAPFAVNKQFQQLTVEDFAMSEGSDARWEQYKRDGDQEVLTTNPRRFPPLNLGGVVCLRAESGPGWERRGTGTFADQLEHLKLRPASQPVAMPSFVRTIVLSKRE